MRVCACAHAHVCVVWLAVVFVFSDTCREALVWVCRDGKGPVARHSTLASQLRRELSRAAVLQRWVRSVWFLPEVAPLPWSKRPVSVCLSGFSPSLICLPLFAPLESLFRKPPPGPSVLNHYFVYFPRAFPPRNLPPVLSHAFCMWCVFEDLKALFPQKPLQGPGSHYNGWFTARSLWPPRQSWPGPADLLGLLAKTSKPHLF